MLQCSLIDIFTVALAMIVICMGLANGDEKLKFDRMDAHDKNHIKEHLDGVVQKNTAEMSDEELEFHYFKLHDYDNNNKLDGLEIARALQHNDELDGRDPNSVGPGETDNKPQRFSEQETMELIDSVLQDEDLDNDGYVDYSEFISAQRRSPDDQLPPPPPPTPVPAA